ncbi:MAG: acyl-CoA thioesterase [Acidimicrobiia bacterium]|nr:acyl-CoA thioesterase [Acidimicrobiia bacterium]
MTNDPTGRATDHEFRVRWGETDAFGIVFYPTFYAWMDQATHEFFRTEKGAFMSMLADDGYGFPIIEAGCKFSAPARYDDLLMVASVVTDVRSRTFRIDHRFTRDGQKLARGFEVRAFAASDPDNPTRLTTTPFPDTVRRFLAGDSDAPI